MKTEILFAEVEGILREVGAILLDLRKQGLTNGVWQASQLKSEADLVAEQLIVGRLCALSPRLPVVSEEDLLSHNLKGSNRYWLVDPIDGTASFCGGYAGFVTQVALMEGNVPVFGVVYGPALGDMYIAERGAGASQNGRPIRISDSVGDVVLIDNYAEPRGVAKLLYDQLPCAGYLESGSIGLKICKVAQGQADLFVKDVVMRDWDLAPGHLILREAGGLLTDLRGLGVTYGGSLVQSGGLIASGSKELSEKVIGFLTGVMSHGL